MIKIDWLDTFNRLHDAAQRRQDVLHRLRRLQDTTEGDIELTDEQEGAFAIVRDFAEGDHRLAVTHLVEYAQHVPMDRLAQLSTDARTKLGTRLATLGANQGDGSVLAAGLALGAVPYPLLSNPQVVKRAELLDLVLAECTAERLNAPSNDQGLLVWETVMQAVPTDDPDGDDERVAHLANVVVPRLAQAGADLERTVLGARPSERNDCPLNRRAHLLADALVLHQGHVLRQSVGVEGAARGRKRL